MTERSQFPKAEIFHHREILEPISMRLRKRSVMPTFEVDRIDIHYNDGERRFLRNYFRIAPYFILIARLTNVRIPRPGVKTRTESKKYRAKKIAVELAPHVDSQTDNKVLGQPLHDMSLIGGAA